MINDPEEIGKQLRTALVEHIRLAKKTGQFKRSGMHYFIDIDEVVKHYLPEGCTFDYAESVLTSAGFTLDPRPSPDVPGIYTGDEEESDVVAFLGYAYNLVSFEDVNCVVALRPAKPYQYSLVHRVITTCGFSFYI